MSQSCITTTGERVTMSQRPSKGMSKNNGLHTPSNNLDSTGNNGSKYDRHTANTLRDVPRGFSQLEDLARQGKNAR